MTHLIAGIDTDRQNANLSSDRPKRMKPAIVPRAPQNQQPAAKGLDWSRTADTTYDP
jgi:hypothetical protein